jgi:hypothetical protein
MAVGAIALALAPVARAESTRCESGTIKGYIDPVFLQIDQRILDRIGLTVPEPVEPAEDDTVESTVKSVFRLSFEALGLDGAENDEAEADMGSDPGDDTSR